MKKGDSTITQFIVLIIFWGSLWGLAEATLGHILHILGIPGLAGFVMFPVGLWTMIQAYTFSGRRSAVLATALVACCIKLTDFVLPAPTPLTVINPAVAILLESLVAMAFLPAPAKTGEPLCLPRLAGMAFSWRVLYAFVLGGLSLVFPVRSFFDLGWERMLSFFGLESLVNSVLLFLIFKIRFSNMPPYSSWSPRRRWSYFSVLLFLAAVIMQVVI